MISRYHTAQAFVNAQAFQTDTLPGNHEDSQELATIGVKIGLLKILLS